MFAALSVRKLKPGSFDDWRQAWEPDEWPETVAKAYILRNLANPNEVIAFGLADASLDELTALRDDPRLVRDSETPPARADGATRRVGVGERLLRGGRGRPPDRGGPLARIEVQPGGLDPEPARSASRGLMWVRRGCRGGHAPSSRDGLIGGKAGGLGADQDGTAAPRAGPQPQHATNPHQASKWSATRRRRARVFGETFRRRDRHGPGVEARIGSPTITTSRRKPTRPRERARAVPTSRTGIDRRSRGQRELRCAAMPWAGRL